MLKKPLLMIGLTAIAFLFTPAILSESLAIDVYHFLVQYKNGRIAEKVSLHSEENYKEFSEGYVADLVLLDKKNFSLHQFIEAFGEKNYYRFMIGEFGVGLEEQIIFLRNARGLGVNPQALPSPDKRSKELEKEFARMIQGGDQEDMGDSKNDAVSSAATNKTRQPDSPILVSLPQKNDGPEVPSDWLAKDIDPASHLRLSNPLESDQKEDEIKIVINRFLAEFINGSTVEKVSTQSPETYRKQFKDYVRRVALIEKESYTIKAFKKAFGENSYQLLSQGCFGKDDVDMVMENRIKRGMEPHPSVLPAPSETSGKLVKQLNRLIGEQ